MEFSRSKDDKNEPNTHLSGQQQTRVRGKGNPLLAHPALLELGHKMPVHDGLASVDDF